MTFAMRHFILFVGFVAFVSSSFGQTGSAALPSNNGDEQIIQGIRTADQQSVLAAGKSGNKQFIPYLQELYKNKRFSDYSRAPAQLALAKLGDTTALKEIYCELTSGAYEYQEDVVNRKLRYIGGWFSVRLTDEVINGRITEHPAIAIGNSDLSTGDKQILGKSSIVQWLDVPRLNPEIVTADEWREYLAANRDRLAALVPRGDDIFSVPPRCSNPKKKRRK